MFKQIVNPESGRKVDINGKIGRYVLNKYAKLLYGGGLLEMPQLCYGLVNHFGQNDIVTANMVKAFDIGYRHFDGADAYGNDQYIQSVQRGFEIILSKISRDEIWITWKGDSPTQTSISNMIDELGCQYFDTYLIHHSCGNDKDFEHLTKCVETKLIKQFGVSNCENLSQLALIKSKYDIKINQIQARPQNGKIKDRKTLPPNFINECNLLDINVMLFAPYSGIQNAMFIGEDIGELFQNPLIIPWYIQKFIKNTKNIIMIGTVYGNSLKPNYDSFINIIDNNKLLSTYEMNDIETKINQITIAKQ